MVYDIGGTQQSPKRTPHWWAWGGGSIGAKGFKRDFHVPLAKLTDPLFAPPNANNDNWNSPNQQGLGMFPSWFWTRNWPHPTVLRC